LIKEN